MAAGSLPEPGTKLGPCKAGCAHLDCEETREMAKTNCRICQKPIGYETRFFQEGSMRELVHEECLENELEKAIKQKQKP